MVQWLDGVFNIVTNFSKRIVHYGDSMGGGPYASTNTLGSMVLHQSYIWPENEYINEYVGGLVLGTNGDTQTSGSMFADASNRIDTLFITNIPCYLIMNGGINDMVPTVGNQTALTAWLRWSNSITTRLLINPGWRPYYWLYGNCSNNPTTTSRLIEFNGREGPTIQPRNVLTLTSEDRRLVLVETILMTKGCGMPQIHIGILIPCTAQSMPIGRYILYGHHCRSRRAVVPQRLLRNDDQNP